MKVKEIMTTGLFTLRSDHKLDLADDMMKWQRIRHIPVVNQKGNLVGLLTHRDLLRASVSTFAQLPEREQRELHQHIQVGDIMQKNVATLSPEADIREAAALMIDKKIGCVPVVKNEKLVGIVTEADFLTLAWETLGKSAKQREFTSVRKYTKHADA